MDKLLDFTKLPIHADMLFVFRKDCMIVCVWFSEKVDKTVKIEASTVEIEERGVKLRLTVVDTPGFADAINNDDRWGDMLIVNVMKYMRSYKNPFSPFRNQEQYIFHVW